MFICSPLSALNFGLVTNQYGGYGDEGYGTDFEYKADFLPRFTFLLGDSGELLLSAGLSLGIKHESFFWFPQLLRSELFYRFGDWGLRLGRMQYADPTGFVATGLFDGARVSYNSSLGAFSLGAWYTGLLYKKNGYIIMTSADQEAWDAPLDYGDFFKTYFASRRLLASMDWEHLSVANLFQLKAALTAQMDFSDGQEKYHSQYLSLKAVIPYKNFTFEMGASLETAEFEPALEGKNFNIAYAWNLGIIWELPTSFRNRLSLTGHFSGGQTDGITGAFVPVASLVYGEILKAKPQGITALSLDYMARLTQVFGMSLSASYFVRNDLGTYTDWPVADSGDKGHFLGTELFARLVWSPFSDLQLNLGGGVFLPQLGDAGPKEKPGWRIELSAILAIY
ncbi:MAG: hypothetical protein LBI06_05405 [Treponema sp.]|nr:hypothetical protein [Treponema sp.]